MTGGGQETTGGGGEDAGSARSRLAGFGPELAQLVVVGMWASTFIVTKASFAEISPLAFVFVRFALMTLLAFGVLAARRPRGERGVRRADLGRFVVAGVTGYTLYQLGFVLGLDRTSPFSSSLLIAMVPLFTVLILAIMGERTPRRGWFGLGIAVVGVAVFLGDKRGADGSLLGDALSLGAAVAFASYGLANRPLVAAYPPETSTAYATLAGSVPLLAVSAPAAVAQDWGAVSAIGWVGIVYMTIFPVYVAYMLWNWAIARRGAAAATSFSLLVPIVSGALSAAIFGEGFGAAKLVGAALVLGGLVVARTRGRRGRELAVEGDGRFATTPDDARR